VKLIFDDDNDDQLDSVNQSLLQMSVQYCSRLSTPTISLFNPSIRTWQKRKQNVFL